MNLQLQRQPRSSLTGPLVPFRVQTHEVGPRVLDIFGNEQASRGASPLPVALAELDGLVLVGQRTSGT
jgi:hypothetical protein